MADNWRGISFPFQFGTSGGVKTSIADNDKVDHIRESIVQAIMTSKVGYERVMKPEFGSRLSTMVFEPENEATKALIIQEIFSTIAENVDNAVPISVNIWYQDEKLYADITFISRKYKVSGNVTVNIGGE